MAASGQVIASPSLHSSKKLFGANIESAARAGAAFGQALAINQPRPKDRDVFKANPPDQAVLPMAVAKVLIHVPLVVLRQIVSPIVFVRAGGEQPRALIQIKRDVALEPD